MLDRFYKKEKPFSGIQGFGGVSASRSLEPITDEQTYVYSSNNVVSASRPASSIGKEMQSVRFYVQGAGGGRGTSVPSAIDGNIAQSGGFTDYTHTSNLQNTYKLVIGQAGIQNSGGNSWGGGGDGGNMTGRGQLGGGGGGGSFVFYEPVTSFISTNPNHPSIVVCSGGGGGAFFSVGPSPFPGSGGKGGTTTGQTGTRGTVSGNGTGGTQSGGGSGGPNYPSGSSAGPGSNHQGGSSSQSGYEYGGGGGGGGYYGGGAGGSCVSVCPGPSGNGAGGGGSSYYRSSEGTLNSWTQGYDSSSPKYDATRGGANQPGKITIVWEWLG